MLEPRGAVAGLTAYDPEHIDARINLSANENGYGLPPAIRERLTGLVAGLEINRYPDPGARELREAIGARHGVDPRSIAVGNGGDELLQALLLAYGGAGRTAAAFTPTFVMYDIISRTTGTKFVPLARNEDYDVPVVAAALVQTTGADIVFICSPNNPTGNTVSREAVAEIAGATGGLVVIDEAYQEFSRETVLDMIGEYRNLLVLRTFSKAFALAGLRVGYMIGDPEVVENINKVRLPYNVNVFSQAAAASLMRDPGTLPEIISEIISERGRLASAIGALDGYAVFPSQSNFLLVRCAQNGTDIWRGLLEARILVRNFSRTPGLENCLRITVGTKEENDAVIGALTALKRVGGSGI